MKNLKKKAYQCYKKMISPAEGDKGVTTMEFVLGSLIIIMLLGFVLDLLMLFQRFSAANDTCRMVARTLSVQGGIQHTVPNGYPENYYTTARFREIVNESLIANGLEEDGWRLQYRKENGEYEDFMSSTELNDIRIDYLKKTTVRLIVTYRWEYISTYLPISPTSHLVCTLPVASEWKHDYSNWDSEVR